MKAWRLTRAALFGLIFGAIAATFYATRDGFELAEAFATLLVAIVIFVAVAAVRNRLVRGRNSAGV